MQLPLALSKKNQVTFPRLLLGFALTINFMYVFSTYSNWKKLPLPTNVAMFQERQMCGESSDTRVTLLSLFRSDLPESEPKDLPLSSLVQHLGHHDSQNKFNFGRRGEEAERQRLKSFCILSNRKALKLCSQRVLKRFK